MSTNNDLIKNSLIKCSVNVLWCTLPWIIGFVFFRTGINGDSFDLDRLALGIKDSIKNEDNSQLSLFSRKNQFLLRYYVSVLVNYYLKPQLFGYSGKKIFFSKHLLFDWQSLRINLLQITRNFIIVQDCTGAAAWFPFFQT